MTARCTLATGVAVLCATTLGLAQTTPNQPGQRTSDDKQTVTVVGCLQEEKDVPGRQPNVAERAGVGEDFILTQASKKGGSKDESARGSSAGSSGSTASSGTSGSAKESHGMGGSHNMYKITGIDDEKLRPHVGKRVELMGRVEMPSDRSTGTAGAASTTSANKDDLPQLRASSIKQVASSCQSTQ